MSRVASYHQGRDLRSEGIQAFCTGIKHYDRWGRRRVGKRGSGRSRESR